jgi:type I restriction enzyme R subunit
MNNIGHKERATQNRVIKLFRERLGYDYLDNREDKERSLPVEDGLLMAYLADAGYSDKLIQKALTKFYKALRVGQGRSLYEANKAVYNALRYGNQRGCRRCSL